MQRCLRPRVPNNALALWHITYQYARTGHAEYIK
jgi:hypothetical protein